MKYEIVKSDYKEFEGIKVYRIRYLSDGSLGGYIQSENNLSQDGNAQVYGDALVYGNARVSENAQVSGNARVFGNAQVFGDAWVSGDARVSSVVEIIMLGPIGSRNAMLSAYFDKDKNILVSTGCFLGSMSEFEKAVKDRYANKGFGKDYSEAIKFIKSKMKRVKEASHDKLAE